MQVGASTGSAITVQSSLSAGGLQTGAAVVLIVADISNGQ
jgi:hypothetical protein